MLGGRNNSGRWRCSSLTCRRSRTATTSCARPALGSSTGPRRASPSSASARWPAPSARCRSRSPLRSAGTRRSPARSARLAPRLAPSSDGRGGPRSSCAHSSADAGLRNPAVADRFLSGTDREPHRVRRGMATKQTVQLLMPEMGESVTEGTVLEWHVSEGDVVEEGQTMVEVSTDKVDAEVPAPAAGTVTSILVQPDETVEVGKALADIDPNGGPPEAKDEAPAEEEAPADPDAGTPTAEETPATGDGSEKATSDDASVSAGKALEGGGLEIVMPEMGESVTEGTVLEWHVSEGDAVAEGDTVVEVSTDKVDAEVPAPAD